MAAIRSVSEQLNWRKLTCECEAEQADNLEETRDSITCSEFPTQDGEVFVAQYQQSHDERGKQSSTACFKIAGAYEGTTEQEFPPGNLEGDSGLWIRALEGQHADYIDYAVVARERVSAARRTRGSDLKRGPACPVCNG